MSSPAQKSDPRYSPPQAYLGVPAVESAGRLCTGPILAGFAAGRIARRAEVEHAFVFGACSACLSFLVIGLQEPVAKALQDPEFLFSLALGVAAACFGGQLAATQRDAEFLNRSG
ncbi:MAG: hypothetical protein GY725_13290 [bacterium]|nr:hypothetical protein [bacterium]